jgi:hypothetical protein
MVPDWGDKVDYIRHRVVVPARQATLAGRPAYDNPMS